MEQEQQKNRKGRLKNSFGRAVLKIQDTLTIDNAGKLAVSGAHKLKDTLVWSFNFKERPELAVPLLLVCLGTAEFYYDTPILGNTVGWAKDKATSLLHKTTCLLYPANC